jgi:hypothetical protein
VLDEMMMVFTDTPIVPAQVRFSYINNPGAFDQVSGVSVTGYADEMRCIETLRDSLYLVGAETVCRTQDNGSTEPNNWPIANLSEKVGGLSTRSSDTGEGWFAVGDESGLYLCNGSSPRKISQEIQNLWDSIDPNLWHLIWMKNDPVTRRFYIGVPLTAYSPTGATFTPASCNKVLVLDYRELELEQLLSNGPLRITLSGKMITSDLTRAWTVWNVPSNSASVLYNEESEPTMTFGGGLGNGLSTGYGNFYTLAEGLYTDDDYGIIGSLNGEGVLRPNGVWRPPNAYYVTFFAPSHEQEQMLKLGSIRKIYERLNVYGVGVGYLYVIPLIDRAGNPNSRPPSGRTLSLLSNYDYAYKLLVKAERMALLIYATPLVTAEDQGWGLNYGESYGGEI